jgi:RHS repeat-associated protein
MSYAYDALGRRISKAVQGGTPTQFLYDGMNAVQETVGSTVNPILIGPGIDERYARNDTTGRTYFLSDALNSTIALTNSSGAIQNTYSYDPYGNTTQSNASLTNPYQFMGREADTAGLYYYRARYYSPMIGFISEDPIGFAGGQLSFYAGFNSDPIDYTDPLGLDSVASHYYSTFIPLCSGNCTPQQAFEAMRHFSAPGAPYAAAGTHDVMLWGRNPIRQTVDPCHLTITNVTLPGHVFGGQVQITITSENGTIGAEVVGSGSGPKAALNQEVGPAIFQAMGYGAYMWLNPSGAPGSFGPM